MRTKKPDSNERNKRKRFRMVTSVIDHITLLSPARILGRVARDNFTRIVCRTIRSGFNVFASGWVLRSAGLKGFGHGGSDARASNAPGAYSFQSRSGVSGPLAIHLGRTKLSTSGP